MPYRNEKEVRDFYERWKVPIFTFCLLFLGDEQRARDVALEGFLAYFREDRPLELTQLPDSLLRCVLESARDRCVTARLEQARAKGLEIALLSLPCEHRAVFILRNVLVVPEASIASATGSSPERVRQLWVQGLFRLRNLLRENFFKEHVR